MEFIVYQNPYNNCCQMSVFPLRIHQNRCQLGLCPRPHWESLQRSSDPLAGFKEGEGREGLGGGEKRGRKEKGGNGEGRGKGEVGGDSALVVGG